MKKLLLLSSIFFIHTITSAQVTHPSGVTGCIARWDFNSTGTVSSLPDVSGQGHNGTTNFLTASQGLRNKPNQAMHFNGTNSFATVPHNTALNPASISIVSVIKFGGFYQGSCQVNSIIIKHTSFSTPGCWGMMVADIDGNCATYTPSNEKLDFAGPSTALYAVTGPSILTNRWYLMATTYNGDSAKRYVVLLDTNHTSNITRVSATKLNTPIGSTTNDVKIGKMEDPSFPNWFNGDMEELTLFNKQLTDADIQSLYEYFWNFPVSIENIANDITLQLYPNPSKGSFTISGDVLTNEKVQFSVYNTLGQLVYYTDMHPSGNTINKIIELGNVANGVYFARIQTPSGNNTIRFNIDR